MSPGINNLGNGNQIRDGLEPCPLVEKIARAIYDASHAGLSNCYSWDEEWEPHQEASRGRYLKEAAAAIKVCSGTNRSEPTQFGDDVAAEMRAYFEAHKRDRQQPGTADNLMLGLYNIVASALHERLEANQSSLDTMGGRIEELAEENAELKQSVIAVAGPWAVEWAEMHELPKGHLAPSHYDLLERCGARMDEFTRASLETRA